MGGVTRVLSIEVTRKGFAFAVLESAERLIDWGGCEVKGDVSVFLERLGRLMNRCRPDLLVIEEPAGSRKGPRAIEWLAWAEQFGVDSGLEVRTVTGGELAVRSGDRNASRYDIAKLMPVQFPELKARLPARSRMWEPESPQVTLLIAVARALVSIQSLHNAP